MIYKNKYAGVTKVESDLNKSTKMNILYRARKQTHDVEFDFFDLPIELRNEYAAASNKIARYLDGGSERD